MWSVIPSLYKLGALMALIITVFFTGYVKGLTHEQNKQARKDLATTVAVVKIKQAQADITAETDRAHTDAVEKIRIVTRTITKEVPVYVTQNDDHACSINVGFVRLHDAAAIGELPPSPSLTDGKASGIALSTVSATVVDNYGTCQETRQQLIDLQDWVVKQGKVDPP